MASWLTVPTTSANSFFTRKPSEDRERRLILQLELPENSESRTSGEKCWRLFQNGKLLECRATFEPRGSGVSTGRGSIFRAHPGIETPGYCHRSLRDLSRLTDSTAPRSSCPAPELQIPEFLPVVARGFPSCYRQCLRGSISVVEKKPSQTSGSGCYRW